MQKGKVAASPPAAMVLQGRPPQQNPRGPPSSQQRPDDFNPRQAQFQIPPQMQQNIVMGQMPGQMQAPQGQPRLPNQQQFFHSQRAMRIPRHQAPNNPPMYSSPPGGPIVQMMGPPGAPQFIPQGQTAPFMAPPVEYTQIPMSGPPQMQFRPQQPMQGQFTPVSASQPQGPYGYPQTTVYPMGQPSQPVYIVRAPAAPMTGMPQFQTQSFEPRARERKIIQIKDPNSNKDVTQEILNRQPSGSITSSTGGTPNNSTPDISGQSSSSSTPPLTSQQQAEANVRAQFAAQVAATLANDNDEKPKKPVEYIIQKAPVNNKTPAVDTVKIKEVADISKDKVVKETEVNSTSNAVTEPKLPEKPVEKAVETQPKEEVIKRQPKEAVQGSKLNEGVSAENSLGSKSLVSSVDAITSTKEIISNVRVEIFTADEVRNKEAQQSSAAVSDVVKTAVEPAKETVEQAATETVPANEAKTLNGPVALSSEEVEKTEEVISVESQPELQAPPVENVPEPPADNKVTEEADEQVAEPESAAKETAEAAVLPSAPEPEDAVGAEKVNGHEADVKVSAAAPKNPVDTQAAAAKDMKKKKQKQRLKDMEKRSSEKGMDLMEAYTEKPVQEEVPEENEEPAVEETPTQTQEENEEAQSEEETWEDKEEFPEPEGGKLTYERDFLLQFQSNPMCMLKPEGLPDLEVVLGQARPPSKSGYQQNKMPKADGGENMFLPSYLRQNSRGGNQSGQRAGRNRNVQPKKVIELAPKNPGSELKRAENRWVRPSEVAKDASEEEKKTEELFRKVRSILNKLTPQKFQTLTQQIIDLDIDTAERLEGAIDLIFEKAIDEAAFSVAYANMCRCLIPKKVVVEKDGAKKEITFRKILLNKCQKEFEKEKSVEKRIHEKLEELSSKGLSEEELQAKKSDLQDEETLLKRRTLGNIRFIGELFKLKMLTENIMHDCVVKLLKSNDEEAFECLCKLLVTIGKDLDHVKAKPRVDQYFAQINKIITARITSARVRFMMQDIVELRKKDWVPRREDNNPKTIDQIHKEAAEKAKKTQMMIQMAKQDKKLRASMGGRDSPRPNVVAPGDETWTTVGRGPRNVSVDPKKFQNIKRPVDSENISLGPGGKGYGAWARGSSGGTGAVGAGAGPSAAAAGPVPGTAADDNRPTGNRYSALAGERKFSAPARASSGSNRQEPRSPISGGGRRGPFPGGEREKALEAVRAVTQPKRNTQEREGGRESPRLTPEAASPVESTSASVSPAPELSEEVMKKKSKSIIEEYLDIRDMKEAVECFKELQSPTTHHVFVNEAFNFTLSKRTSDRNATGRLLHFLLRDGVLTAEQYLDGIDGIFKNAEEDEIDIPQLWKYLSELMGPTAFDGNLDLDELFFQRVLKYVSKYKAAKFFAHMLQAATNESSREDVSAILSRYRLRLNAFFDTEEEAVEFAKDKNIEFALGQANSSENTGSTSQHSARIQEELRTLILKRKARNEEVFEWIDKNVSPTDSKEAPFIRTLVTAVCEDTMEREEGGQCKCNVDHLKDRKNLLQKYIDDNTSLELQALYAVQALFVQLDHPPGFIKSYFDSLYDEEIITEESFNAWESSSEEERGKGVAVAASSEFFRWLRSAAEEPGEES
ncbi:hypothetical protein ACROYT_G022998 [Oculina patagonica]